MNKKILSVAGLFAGIGGFELGFSRAGMKTKLLCESDDLARLVLKRRFPMARIVGDVSELGTLPKVVDVVSAGFPCQNLSMAGDKAGISGSKSTIVDQLFRLLECQKAPWVVIENVYFMLYLARGSGIEYILNRLEELEYRWAYRVVDSRSFGLAQRRRRVFIVASNVADPRNVLLADDETGTKWPKIDLGKPIGFYWTEGRSGHGITCEAIPPLKSGSGIGIPSSPAVLLPDGRVVTPTIEAAERLQGFPDQWTRVLDTNDHRRYRWKLVGNAVSVPVSEWIGQRIVDPGSYAEEDDVALSSGSPWPKAAYNVIGRRMVSEVSETPVKRRLGRLSAFATENWSDLSERALSGFIRRARAATTTLRYPDGFLEALESRKTK